MEVVSLSKLSFFRQWVARVCQSGSKRWTLRRETTHDPFDRCEVKPMPMRLPYGVKEKFCVDTTVIFTGEGEGDWVV